MGKLVIKFQGRQIGEVGLKLGDTRIGRKPGCDIVLNDAGVSGEHAVIKTVGLKSTIQDLDSTNGTFVENKRVKQHELRHNETIIMGEHSLLYRDEFDLGTPAPDRRAAAAPSSQEQTTVLAAFGQLLAVEGKDKGKRMPLVKDEIALDNPGGRLWRILRTSEGYVVHAAAGPSEPRINSKPVPPGGQLLESGDTIDVAGTTFRFFK